MASVLLGAVCALGLAGAVIRRPQPMWIMNLVWPLSGLYAGPLVIWLYVLTEARGRTKPPLWRSALVGTAHCGAGCALGDMIGDQLVFRLHLTLFGQPLYATFAAAFVLAYGFGIVFQFFAIAPMRHLGVAEGLIAAVKADTASLLAFEVGMFAWMALVQDVLAPGLTPDHWRYWAMMQVAMLLGVLTALPVNAWLIKAGVKEAM
jgi:hypothetical protein